MKPKYFFSIYFFIILSCLCNTYVFSGNRQQDSLLKSQAHKLMDQSKPLSFQENKGQMIDINNNPVPYVLYKTEMPNLNIWITTSGITYQFLRVEENEEKETAQEIERDRIWEKGKEDIAECEWHRVDMILKNADIRKENIITENDVTQGEVNYYLGHCSNGIFNVRSYEKITIKEVYPGIDWVLYTSEGKEGSSFKHEFVVHPGADPGKVKLVYEGSGNLTIDGSNISIKTELGELTEGELLCYQGNKENIIPSKYSIKETGKKIKDGFSYEVNIQPGNYNTGEPFIIDPPLTWGTYYGGNSLDGFASAAVDANGNVFVAGYDESTNFPTLNPGGGAYYQTITGGKNVIILKFDNNGVRIWATFYGGTGWDHGTSIASDGLGNIYVTGMVSSTDFPTYSPGGGAFLQASLGSGAYENAFILKFSNSGARLWATYFGGKSWERCYSITTDISNNVYITGWTSSSSSSFPKYNPGGGAFFQTSNAGGTGTEDAFIAKFNSSCQRLWSTFYGGTTGQYDEGQSVATDALGNLYVTCITTSTDFPVYNPGGGAYYQGSIAGNRDIVILKFNSSCARLWATYCGGSSVDDMSAVTTDANNNIYITCSTMSSNFPVLNLAGAYNQGSIAGSSDVFILKFNSNCQQLWGTYFGGTSSDGYSDFRDHEIHIDINGNMYLTGVTSSSNFPLMDPGSGSYYKSTMVGTKDIFISEFSNTGALLWSTFTGSTDVAPWGDFGSAVATDANGCLFAVGEYGGSGSNGLKDPGGGAYYWTTAGGSDDSYIMKFCSSCTANAGPDQTICKGSTATLTATGGGTYQWNGGNTNASITVNPTTTTTYTVTITLGSCTASDAVVVTVNALPTANAGADQTICSGTIVTLTATGGGTYQWNGGNTNASITVNPTNTTTYTVTVTLNTCTATDAVIVTVNAVPTANAGADQTICNGTTATLTATGGGTYLWNGGNTNASITVNPAVNTTYTVTVTLAGCTASDAVAVKVNALPTANAGADQTICNGTIATLTATGGGTYQWNGGNTNASVTVNPAVNATYTVTVTVSGCTDDDQVVVVVNALPTANAGADQTICNGTTATLTATGGGTYQWNGGNTNASVTVNPAVNATYTVTVTVSGCTDDDQVVVVVNALPTANAGADQTICNGTIATLTATGGGTYQWNGGNTNASVTVNPAVNATYTVTVTVSGCTDDDQVVVVVNALPTANAGADQTICSGTTATLTASGGGTYLWNGGSTNASVTVNPGASATYTVTVTVSGCTDDDQVTVVVNTTPTANAGADQTMCNGITATLTATGGGTYQWNGGNTNASITVNPVINTTYTVTVTSSGCTASDVVVVTVNTTTADAGADATICTGGSAVLTASGGTTYLWNGGSTNASITVNPGATSTYTVTVTNNGCTASDNVIVTIGASLVVSAGADQTICNGTTATLTASGGATYQWDNGETTTTITVNPAITTTYTVTADDGAGCTGTDAVVVTVNALPTANAGADQTICNGTTATLTASGGGTYLWNGGSTNASVTVNPAVNATYTVTVTVSGCTDDDQITVVVNTQPTANAGADQTICNGTTATLTASGGGTYLWNGGSTNASITVNPGATATYTVTVTNSGCTASDCMIVTVNAVPTANAGADQTICNGTTATLTASGGGTYQWNGGNTNASVTVNPAVNATYTVTVTVSGCTDDDQMVVVVNTQPTANAGADQTICNGTTATLTASGGGTYLWNGGSTNASVTVSPAVNATYTVTVNLAGCTASDEVAVKVNALPTANAGADQTICNGATATLSAIGGGTYLWNGGNTNSSISVTPAVNATYTVTVTVGGCTDDDQVIVVVNALPTANAGADQTICNGTTATLTASGGGTYLWNAGSTNASVTVNPGANITYTVTVTVGGCTDDDQVTVVVNALPTANAGDNCSICNGNTATLTTSGGSTYSWNTGATTAAITVNPGATITYTVTVTVDGCTDDDQVAVTVNALPTANAGADQTICNSTTATLTASGGGTYLWNGGTTTASVTVNPPGNTTYTVTVTAGGCTDDDQVVVVVNALPTVSAGADLTICTGGSAVLTANGGTTYQWNGGFTTQSITVTPAVNTTYTVTATQNGCTGIDNVVVTIGTSLVASAGGDQTICTGTTATLTASGGATYQWDNGETTTTITVNPAITTTYTVTADDGIGCTGTAEVIVTVNVVPTADAGVDQTICNGTTAIITASGGDTYAWNTGATSDGINVTPGVNITYTVTVTTDGCTDDDQIVVVVKATPTANAGADQTICNGVTATINASGGGTYLWNNGATTAGINATPAVNITYTVTVTSAGCTASDAVTITVNAVPTADAGSNQTICNGTTVTLIASGGGTYLWNGGSTNTSVTVSPAVNATYTVTVTAGGCSDDDQVTIVVNALPTANAGADVTICTGGIAVLTANGGTSYQWNTGVTTQSITVNPGATITYSVTVTQNGCTGTDNVVVTIGTSLTASAGGDQTICTGTTATLTAGGGSVYNWNTGETTLTITVNPVANATYTVTVDDGSGCTGSDEAIITVSALPTADAGADQSICNGTTATITASGGGTYLWNTGNTNSSITVNPSITSTYTITVTTGGCTDTDEVTVTSYSGPLISAGADVTICSGNSTVLTASNGATYQWNTGETTQSITVSPGTNTTYTVTGADVNMCTGTDEVIVTTGTSLPVSAGVDTSICEGENAILSASGAGAGGTYSWNTGSTNSTITVNPVITTTYTVTGTDASACIGTDEIIITVTALPTADAGADQAICIDSTVTLTASGGGTYLWNTGSTATTINVSPTVNTTYTVTVTLNNCTDDDQVIITVNALPTADAGADQTICNGGAATLTATGGSTYQWSTSATGASINVIPTTMTTYTVTVTANTGCTGTDEIAVSVGSVPSINLGTDTCIGSTANSFILLDAGAGFNTYLWQDDNSSQTYNVIVADTFWVVATNDCGSATDTIVVTDCSPAIWIPNSFTPDDDNKNDIFKAVGINIEEFEMYIYDRWGSQIFHSTDLDEGWDGRYKGKICQEGVYVYIIIFKEMGVQGSVTRYGRVTLLK